MKELIYSGVFLLLLVLTAFGVPFLRQRLGEAKFHRLCQFARTAVRAAEQLLSDATGKEKLSYVKETLENAGFPFDRTAQIAVESAVLEEKKTK